LAHGGTAECGRAACLLPPPVASPAGNGAGSRAGRDCFFCFVFRVFCVRILDLFAI
jgi:hypothetical protein